MRRHGWMLLLPTLLLGGCTAFVTRQITRPGHHLPDGEFRELLTAQGLQRESLRTVEGLRIAYWLVPPRAYRVRGKVERTVRDGRVVGGAFKFRIGADAPARLPPLPAKGSVLLLHPWGMSGVAMLPWALKYAQAGYVAVVPDLRSQGSSGDAPIGYGPREAADMVDLARQLRSTGHLPGPLYLVGASYGATVALYVAPGLPQLRGVLALEPYANAAATIRRAPASGLFGHRWLARWITPREVDAAIARASRQLGVDLALIDAGDAVAASAVCTLVLRGSDDRLITAAALHAISARSPRARYVEVPGENHLSLPISLDRLFQPSLEWMRALADGAADTCPAFSVQPRPGATASPAAGIPASAPAPTAIPAPAAGAPATAGR